uniref:Uncharacterized protein n=1 Tax=Arundo donax TaxID=35708 RepID=A0A0A8ZBL7_ARUDO
MLRLNIGVLVEAAVSQTKSKCRGKRGFSFSFEMEKREMSKLGERWLIACKCEKAW